VCVSVGVSATSLDSAATATSLLSPGPIRHRTISSGLRAEVPSRERKVVVATGHQANSIAVRATLTIHRLLQNSGDVAKPLDAESGDARDTRYHRDELQYLERCYIRGKREDVLVSPEPMICR